jgi:c-di-GMP phosphodiesterase
MQERTDGNSAVQRLQTALQYLFGCAILLTHFISTVLAQPPATADATAADTTVTFGGALSYPPFHFVNNRDVADGFDVSIFNRIAQINGWRTEYRFDDWQTIQQALLTESDGESVDIVPMFVSAERQALYLFSNPIHVEYHLLFGPATANTYPSLSALSSERIAAEGGAYATAELLKLNPDITIVNTSSEAEALMLVANGLADVALLPSEIGRYNLRTLRLEQLAALSPPLLPVTYAFAINPTRPELLAAANAGIDQLQRLGELESLRNRWLYAEPVSMRERALMIVSWTIPLVLVLAIAAFFVVRFYRLQLEDVRSNMREKIRQLTTEPDRSAAPDTSLTGLPDRKLQMQQLDYEITLAKHQRLKRAYAVFNLLNLEALQDAFDDEAGDELVRQFAAAIPVDWAEYGAHISPGMFGFIVKDAANAEQQMNSLLVQCSQPVMIRDLSIHPHLCAGLAVYPDHAISATDLLHKAKMAMNQAKRSGAHILPWSPEMKPDPRRIQVISDLRHALAQRQLQWAVQPQFSVATGRVAGAELLARWNHPIHGWLPPCDFITWAEEAGLISQISDQLIEETTALFELMSSHSEPFYLSINLSANDLANDALVESLIHKVRAKKTNCLTVEVTETALMVNKKAALQNIDRLKQAGFRVALDDYGTGYASMEYLHSFNFDEIKIDRLFINGMTSIERNRKLTQASIELGHQLGASVVAEGVEDSRTASMLVDMGCDVLQGYQIGRPLLLGDFNEIRQSWRQVAL